MLKVLFALASLFAYESSAATLPGERFPYLFHPGQGVLTTSGLVSGRAASKLTDVSEYLGIRYAKPPVGSLRFAAPERFLGFGKVDATSYVCVDSELSTIRTVANNYCSLRTDP